MSGRELVYNQRKVTKDDSKTVQKGPVRRIFNRFKGRLAAGALGLTLLGSAAVLQGCTKQPTEQTPKEKPKPKLTPEDQKELNGKLLESVIKGETEKVGELLDDGADVNARFDGEGRSWIEGWTALAVAIREKNTEIIKLLIEKGADLEGRNNDNKGATSLMIASAWGNAEIVEFLLKNGADINSEDKIGDTALRYAINFGNVSSREEYLGLTYNREYLSEDAADRMDTWGIEHKEIVRVLLDKGANKDINKAFIGAAFYGFTEIVELFLDRGVDINVTRDNPGWTALMAAIPGNNIKLVKLLLDKGADIHIKDMDKDTTIMQAAYYGHVEIIKLLLEAGADVNAKNERGDTALMEAACYAETLKLLLEAGADVNARDNKGHTALMSASGSIDSVRVLLKNGAKVNIRSNSGKTALTIAEKNEDRDVAYLLKKYGAKR